MDRQSAPRILITRLSHIGDCLLTLPMLVSLKRQLPQAEVFWAVESPTHQLLGLHREIDHLIKIPKRWASRPSNWISLRRELRRHQFDIAIDPQGITKSAGLGWLSNAPIRLGVRGRWGRELSTWMNNRLVETKSLHVADRSLDLLAGIGLDTHLDAPAFELPVCEAARCSLEPWLQQLVDSLGLERSQLVMINPGGSWASKRWEMDRFGQVAQHLRDQHGLMSVVVWAGDEEQRMAQTIVDHADGAAVLACPTSLTELGALASQCRFFLGSDTGPLHLASAMGTPCVGLYGTTQPAESGAYGPQHIAVQKRYHDGTCRQRRTATNAAMREISVTDVCKACDRMLETTASSSCLNVRSRVA